MPEDKTIPDYTSIPTTLIHRLIIAIIAAIIAIGGYMVFWDRTYQVRVATIDLSLQAITETIDANLKDIQEAVKQIDEKLIHHPHSADGLPNARWRLERIERFINEHNEIHKNKSR